MDKKQNISPLLIRQGFLIRNSISLFPSVLHAVNYYQGLMSRQRLTTDHLRKIGVIRLIPMFLSDLFKREILNIANFFEYFVLGPRHTLNPSDISGIRPLLSYFIDRNISAGIEKNKWEAEFLRNRGFMEPPSPLFSSTIHTKGVLEDYFTKAPLHYSHPFQKEMDFVKFPTLSTIIKNMVRTIIRNKRTAEFIKSREFVQSSSPFFPLIINVKGGMEDHRTNAPLYYSLPFIKNNMGATIIKNILRTIIGNKETAEFIKSK